MPLPVLLVEDDPTTHAIVRTALAGGGRAAEEPFALQAVTTLGAALERIERDPPAAVLLDLGLPDSDGLETFRRVRQRAPGLAIVILTATDDDALALVAVREGAQDWIVKQQVDPRLLPRVVRYAIERRRAEQLLDESAEQLRAARHQAAVGRLAGGMAHAFNNMLTIIRCGAELLRDQVELEQQRADLSAMLDAASRASALVKQLLAFSSRQVLRPSPTDLGVLVQGIVPVLSKSLGDAVTFTVDTASRLPPVRIDAVQFEQVITELVLDARDAMPDGGAIRLSTSERRVEAPEPHLHGQVTPGRYVVLAVHDDAPIDAELLEHVFEPFFARSGHVRDGSLGLAVAYGIVRQSGGHIRVRAGAGDGTTFELFLPAHDAAAPAPPPPTVLGDEPAGSDQRVLVVEDDERIRELVTRLLRKQGWTVAEARHGFEALELLHASDGAFDLVLTDISMPELGGKELVDRLRLHWPFMRILFMSGYADAESTREAMGGEVAFLPKPFTAVELSKAVLAAWLADPVPWPAA